MAQIKALYKRASESANRMTDIEANEFNQYNMRNPRFMFQAHYFMCLMGEAQKSGFDYAINHY